MSKRAKLILNMALKLENNNEELPELTALKNVSYYCNNDTPNSDGGGTLVNTDEGLNVLNGIYFNRIDDSPMYTKDGINLWLQQTNSKIQILDDTLISPSKQSSTEIVDNMTTAQSFEKIKIDKSFCIESLDENKIKVTHQSRDGRTLARGKIFLKIS